MGTGPAVGLGRSTVFCKQAQLRGAYTAEIPSNFGRWTPIFFIEQALVIGPVAVVRARARARGRQREALPHGPMRAHGAVGPLVPLRLFMGLSCTPFGAAVNYLQKQHSAFSQPQTPT